MHRDNRIIITILFYERVYNIVGTAPGRFAPNGIISIVDSKSRIIRVRVFIICVFYELITGRNVLLLLTNVYAIFIFIFIPTTTTEKCPKTRFYRYGRIIIVLRLYYPRDKQF